MTGPVDTCVWGQRLRLFPDRSVSEARILFLPRSWDRAERRLLGRWASSPGFTFVDVGANVGGYSFWVLSCNAAAGRVVAVEPNPSLARQLRYNVRVNGAGDRIRVVEAAVGAARGEGALTVGSRNSGENRLVGATREGDGDVGPGREQEGSLPAAATVPVNVVTLSDVVEEAGLDRVDCLKVDVEGREAEVIQPYLSTAPRATWPRYMIVELKRASRDGADPAALEAWITARGYRPVLRTRLNGLFELA